MVSKCTGIAVMDMSQVGVRTRARAALAMGATTSARRTPKRRKISNKDIKFSASSFVQPQGRSCAVIHAEVEERCSSPTSNEYPASCCSSNGPIGLDEERIKFIDLEVDSGQAETSTCNCVDERREMSPSIELPVNSEDVKPWAANSSSISMVQKMPTKLELEEFFTAAEKDIQKRFAEKYNFDIVKDMPLEGRYEWVQIKP